MDTTRPLSGDELQSRFDQIHESLSVADMTAHHGQSVATARRVIEVRRRIYERVREIGAGAQFTDWDS